MQLNERYCLTLLLLCLLGTFKSLAQAIDTTNILTQADYESPKTYEIGGLKVVGNHWTDKSALLNIAGLRIGDKVEIPSVKISNALKALWKIGLFSDVEIYQEKTVGEIVYLVIDVEEVSRLSGIKLDGVKKSKLETVENLVLQHLQIGRKLTDYQKNNAIESVKQYYLEEGFADVTVNCRANKEGDVAKSSPSAQNEIELIFIIDKKDKVKVARIDFTGNEAISDKKLIKILGIKTKGKLFANSKLIEKELEAGKEAIIATYKTLGFLDAQISQDSIWRQVDGNWALTFKMEEGRKYYFGNVIWKGNSVYRTEDLAMILGIEKGDIFNENHLQSRLQFSVDGRDVSGLYMDHGYLFFNAEAIQKSIRKDTIDLVINILEGSQATIDKVIIKGNTKTNEHVIRRELRTLPGQKFSRSAIIRSQRALMNMGYFNPETMSINTPVNPQTGTVDVEYVVEEKSNDQFELSGGWGGGTIGLTGSVGITLNNFSLGKLFKPKTWNPLPMGDGQHTSIRFQTNGKAYQSLNLSFTEPWLGGKQPNSLTTGFFYSRYFDDNSTIDLTDGVFNIFGANISLGSRITFPDDNTIATTALSYQRYRLDNWSSGLFTADNGQVLTSGTFNNLSLKQSFARSTINHPIFPTNGSKISLSMQFTVPYSLFSKKDYTTVDAAERYQWLEYHKWRLNAEWYTPITKKLILKTSAKFGFLGNYNQSLGTAPFGRFQIGGDGLSNVRGGFTGTDIISLRGYEVEDLENNLVNGNTVATPIFNKFSLELRYPISTNPNATFYGLAFLEAGNAYQSLKDYNPFNVKRSAGFGVRAHLPMFGTLGFDYGLGFDKSGPKTWQNFAKISVILGFEPE